MPDLSSIATPETAHNSGIKMGGDFKEWKQKLEGLEQGGWCNRVCEICGKAYQSE
jgi:hypothetical protein